MDQGDEQCRGTASFISAPIQGPQVRVDNAYYEPAATDEE